MAPGFMVAFVFKGEPRTHIRFAEVTATTADRVTLHHHIDCSKDFDPAKPVDERKLTGEYASPSHDAGIINPERQRLRNYWKLVKTYSYSSKHFDDEFDAEVYIVIDRFELELKGLFGVVPASTSRKIRSFIDKPAKKAHTRSLPEDERDFYSRNMAIANSVMPFPQPEQTRKIRRPRDARGTMRLVDFLPDMEETKQIEAWASALGYSVVRDDVPVAQTEATCGFNAARAACILRMCNVDGRWKQTTSVFHAVDEEWIEKGREVLQLDRLRWLSEQEVAHLILRWNPDTAAEHTGSTSEVKFGILDGPNTQYVEGAEWAGVDSLDAFLARVATGVRDKVHTPETEPAIMVVNLSDSREGGSHWIAVAWCSSR